MLTFPPASRTVHVISFWHTYTKNGGPINFFVNWLKNFSFGLLWKHYSRFRKEICLFLKIYVLQKFGLFKVGPWKCDFVI